MMTAKSLIDEFETFSWFQSTGAPVESNVPRATSWVEAVKFSATPEWESVQFQVRNRLSVCVNQTDYARFTQWNTVVPEINRFLEPIIEKYAKPIAQREELKKSFLDGVGWDLMMACLEAEGTQISSHRSSSFVKCCRGIGGDIIHAAGKVQSYRLVGESRCLLEN